MIHLLSWDIPPCSSTMGECVFIHHWNKDTSLIRTLPLVPAQCECVFIHHWNKDTSLIRTLPLVPAQCECVFIHHWNKDTSLIRTLPLVPAQCECVYSSSHNVNCISRTLAVIYPPFSSHFLKHNNYNGIFLRTECS